jgi:membrane protein implicated in regulation of membrane protease activity
MTLRANPRILVVFVILPAILVAGLLALFIVGPLYGLIGLAAAFYLAWQIVRLVRRQLATRIETLTDEVVFSLHGDEHIVIPWGRIRVAGIAQELDGRGRARRRGRRLFIYAEEDDRLLALTDEFEGLDTLAAELRPRTDFRELTLGEGETLRDRLRRIVAGD